MTREEGWGGRRRRRPSWRPRPMLTPTMRSSQVNFPLSVVVWTSFSAKTLTRILGTHRVSKAHEGPLKGMCCVMGSCMCPCSWSMSILDTNYYVHVIFFCNYVHVFLTINFKEFLSVIVLGAIYGHWKLVRIWLLFKSLHSHSHFIPYLWQVINCTELQLSFISLLCFCNIKNWLCKTFFWGKIRKSFLFILCVYYVYTKRNFFINFCYVYQQHFRNRL